MAVDGIDEFSALTAAHPLVLVEFRADWCGPCRALEPVLESIASDTDAVVATVDVEANRELAFAHRARSLPTIECYREGERVERLVGAPSERELRDLLRAHGG